MTAMETDPQSISASGPTISRASSACIYSMPQYFYSAAWVCKASKVCSTRKGILTSPCKAIHSHKRKEMLILVFPLPQLPPIEGLGDSELNQLWLRELQQEGKRPKSASKHTSLWDVRGQSGCHLSFSDECVCMLHVLANTCSSQSQL